MPRLILLDKLLPLGSCYVPLNKLDQGLKGIVSVFTNEGFFEKDANRKSCISSLQDALGDVLAQALSAVAKERPADPVQFVADFLLRKHEDAKKIQETTTTIGTVIKACCRLRDETS